MKIKSILLASALLITPIIFSCSNDETNETKVKKAPPVTQPDLDLKSTSMSILNKNYDDWLPMMTNCQNKVNAIIASGCPSGILLDKFKVDLI